MERLTALYFPSKTNLNDDTPAAAEGGSATIDDEQEEFTDDDLEGYAPYSTESSYYEKAQDFKKVIKILRIHYLGLKAKQVVDSEGNKYTVYVKKKGFVKGINDRGIAAFVRWLETRLGQHIILTKWDRERMYQVMMDDMKTWYYFMLENLENFKLDNATFAELRALLNDLLETTYSRAVGGEERRDFRPVSNEVKRLLGIGDKEEKPTQYPMPNMNWGSSQGQQPNDY